MEVTKDTLKNIKIEDIMQWCRENNQVEWLKELATTEIEQNIYPEITYFNKDGVMKTKQDKKQAPIGTKLVQIPFVNIKYEWVKKFFPELAIGQKKKSTKKTMWEMIAEM